VALPKWLSVPLTKAERLWSWTTFAYFHLFTGVPAVISALAQVAGVDWPYIVGAAGAGEIAAAVLVLRHRVSTPAPRSQAADLRPMLTGGKFHELREATKPTPHPRTAPASDHPLQELLDRGVKLLDRCPGPFSTGAMGISALGMHGPIPTTQYDVDSWTSEVEVTLSLMGPEKLAWFRNYLDPPFDLATTAAALTAMDPMRTDLERKTDALAEIIRVGH